MLMSGEKLRRRKIRQYVSINPITMLKNSETCIIYFIYVKTAANITSDFRGYINVLYTVM